MASLREQREATLRGYRKHLLEKGHDDDEWKAIAESSEIPAKYFQPFNGASANDEARINECVSRALGPGQWLRYECYNDDFGVQGESILEISERVSARDGYAAFHGKHVVASDPDYHDWANQYVGDPTKLVYHLCGCHAKECGWQKRGKKVVHISKWRLVTLRDSALVDWSSNAACEKLREKVHHVRTVVKRKVGKQPPLGPANTAGPSDGDPSNQERLTTSARDHGQRIRDALRRGEPSLLDQVSTSGLVGPRPLPEGHNPDAVERRPTGDERGREPERNQRRKRDVQQGLVALAKGGNGSDRKSFVQQTSSDEDENMDLVAHVHSKKCKKRRHDRHRKRSSSSDSRSQSSSSSVVATARDGGTDSLAVASRKKPGRLLRSGLRKMRQYLMNHVGATARHEDIGEDWSSTRVGAYINQVLFVNHSPETMGIRNAREIVTLSTCLDHLLSGQLARLGDVLMQRLKAVESALTAGWTVARHHELIPPPRPAIANDRERDYAAKADMRAARLKDSLQKVQGRKSG